MRLAGLVGFAAAQRHRSRERRQTHEADDRIPPRVGADVVSPPTGESFVCVDNLGALAADVPRVDALAGQVRGRFEEAAHEFSPRRSAG